MLLLTPSPVWLQIRTLADILTLQLVQSGAVNVTLNDFQATNAAAA